MTSLLDINWITLRSAHHAVWPLYSSARETTLTLLVFEESSLSTSIHR